MTAGQASMADRVRAAAVSCFGLGYSPVASGTLGTIGAMLIVGVLWWFREAPWFHFGGIMAGLVAVSLVVGCALGPWAERYYGRKDPGVFVLDELAGYCVALLRLDGEFPARPWATLGVAFVAFRVFDIAKPAPVRLFERWPAGFGIMMDDVVAGVYAWMLVWVVEESFL